MPAVYLCIKGEVTAQKRGEGRADKADAEKFFACPPIFLLNLFDKTLCEMLK